MRSDLDPIVEARGWLNARLAGAPVPPLLLVVGLGEGHLLDLLEADAPGTRVLAIEPDPRAAQAFGKRRDWTAWQKSGRLIYLVDPDYAGAGEAWRIFPTTSDSYKVIVHPAIEADPGPGAVRAVRVMKDILFGVRANAEARRRFAPLYLVNSLRNLPSIAAGRDVRGLTDVFKSLPAIVAGAGPSLDGNIEALRHLPGRAVLIATDTALRPLLHAGLGPQLAVGLDPGVLNARHYHRLPDTGSTWLVGESALDPSAVAPFSDRTCWFKVSHHHPWPWYDDIGVTVGTLEVWGSVLTAAFQVAVLAGCDPIVIVGADLAFTGARPYCRGSTFEFDWTEAVAGGMDLAEVWTAKMATSRNRCETMDVHGSPTSTTQELIAFRDWLASHAARSGRRVMNATGAGILFGEGIEQTTLAAALSRTFDIPSMSASPRVATTFVPAAEMAGRVRAVDRALRGGPPLPLAKEWREFCGDGYDPAAVAAALDAAARALDAGTTLPERVDEPGLQPAAGLVGLPEREAILRATITGQPVPGWARAGVLAVSAGAAGPSDPFSEAGIALERLLGLTGLPLDPPFGLFGEDIELRWDAAVLDYRPIWTPAWRNTLWDYHDALAIGVAAKSGPPRAATVAALRPGIRRLVEDIDAEPRACAYADVEIVHECIRQGVCGYNVVRTAAGDTYVAASQRLGSINLQEQSAETVDRSARRGLLLWAGSEADLVARIHRYIREIALVAILRLWTSVVTRVKGDEARQTGDAPPDIFVHLLHRAAGCRDVPARSVNAMVNDLETHVIGSR